MSATPQAPQGVGAPLPIASYDESNPAPQPSQLPQGYVYQQQPVQQMQYTVPAPVFQQQQQAVVKPNYPAPHDYLVLSVIVMAICALLNLTSLAFGIPALVFAYMSTRSTGNNDYVNASKYSRIAFYLVIINVVYTLLWALLITGLMIGNTRLYRVYY